MKRKPFILATILLISCILPAAAQVVNIDEQSAEAFGVSFQAYFMGSLMAAMGQELPGLTLVNNEEMVSVEFDSFDLSLIDPALPYKTISGTITGDNDGGGSDMEADLTLTGGPVKTLIWTVNDYDPASNDADFTIIADGKKSIVKSGAF